MNFAKSMANFLSTEGYGELGKNIFCDNLPEKLDRQMKIAIAIFNTPSYSIVGRARNSVDFTCQIRVRAPKSDEALSLIHKIYKELDTKGEFTDNDKRFVIRPLNPPQFLLFDETRRANWILNITALSENY